MTSLGTGTLRALAVKSAAWYGATRLWGQLVSWAVTVLLARLLAPQDYGLFAIALSVLSLLELLQEFGLGTALVQRQVLRSEQINAVFWVVSSSSLLLTAATMMAAGPISTAYGEPGLAWVLRILCVNFFLNSLGMVPYSLLTKAMNLRDRSLAEAFATAASALVALALAWTGHGVWALVVGHLARAIVLNVLMAVFAGWIPGLAMDVRGLADLLRFGAGIAGTHITGTTGTTMNTFLLARLLGSAGVGLYAMGQGLTEAPSRLSSAIINQVSLPLFARVQHDRELLAASFLRISKYLAAISLPVQIGLALVAPDLVPALLSPKWSEIVVPFQILCLESALVLATLACSPLLTACGRAKLLLSRSFLSLGALVGATIVGAPFGLVGVVIARVVVMVPLRLTLLIPSLLQLEVPLMVYLRTLGSSVTATALMAAGVLVAQLARPAEASHLEMLAASATSGAAIYLAALFLLDRGLTAEIRTMARDLFSPQRA